MLAVMHLCQTVIQQTLVIQAVGAQLIAPRVAPIYQEKPSAGVRRGFWLHPKGSSSSMPSATFTKLSELALGALVAALEVPADDAPRFP